MGDAPRKTYFLAPTRTHPPNGRIVLGNIIEKAKWPEETVLNQNVTPIPSTCGVYRHLTHDWSMAKVRSHETTPGVFLEFLAQILGLGVEASVGRKAEDTNALTAKVLETVTMDPNPAFVQQVMQEKAIQKVILDKKLWLRHGRVYMITGIKIVRGSALLTKRLRELKLHGIVSADLGILTGTGVPTTVGPTLDYAHKRSFEESYKSADDFVYAYRLSRIRIKRGEYVAEPYRHGTVLDDSKRAKEDSSKIASELQYEIEEADAEEDFDAEAKLVDDDDGHKVLLARVVRRGV